MKALKYWWFRRQNEFPCPEEVRELTAKTPLQSLRILGYALTYCETRSLEETAYLHNVTTERVRQCMWKLYRSVHNVARNV